MFNVIRARIARWIAPFGKIATRMYSGAKQSRLTAGWGTSITSADSELAASLDSLRARSRQLVRDAPYAKRAKVIIQNNVVGAGIGMQAQVKNSRGQLNKRVNDDIEQAWEEWALAANCHTGGSLHFADLERAAMGQVFEAGEVLIRKYYSKFGESGVPLALELIEAERLVSDYSVPGPLANGAHVRMGIEADPFHRPIAYWLRQRHPGEARWIENVGSERYERVPAEQIIHLRVIDRWPQTRGEPWMHAVLRKLNDLDGYSEAEIIAARSAAAYMGVIETPDPDGVGTPVDATGGAPAREITLEPGLVERLAPGEKFSSFAPNRPNSGADPFLRFMLREIAAGCGTSYESLSRDYSQSNYSSSRLALIDDRDLWRTLQRWFVRSLREPLHREWMQQAVLAGAIASIPVDQYAPNPAKFAAVRFKPRGWTWIDPTKEVAAYKEAILAGFTTVSDVIALTGSGRDIEDVLDERKQELELMEEAGLKFDTEFKEAPAPVAAPAAPSAPAEPAADELATETDNAARIAQIVGAAIAEAVRSMKAPQALVNVSSPEINIPPAVVNLKAGDVHIAPPAVTVNTPEMRIENKIETPVPVVNITSPEVHVDNHVPAPIVNVAPTEVRVDNHVPAPIVNVAAPDVRIENRIDAPVVNVPETVVNVAPAAVHIDNRVEVPDVEETEQTIERDKGGEIRKIRTRKLR